MDWVEQVEDMANDRKRPQYAILSHCALHTYSYVLARLVSQHAGRRWDAIAYIGPSELFNQSSRPV